MNDIVDRNNDADGFSTTAPRGAICLPCQQGNLFRLTVPPGARCPVSLMAEVGGKCSPTLPENQGYMLPNDLVGTTGTLNLFVAGKPYTITDDVRTLGGISRPQDVRSHVLFEPLPPVRPRPAWLDNPPAMVPIGRSSMRPAGQNGSVPGGHEYNALDAISEDRWRQAGSPQTEAGEILPATSSDPIVMVIEPAAALGSPPAVGSYDVDTMPEELVNYFVSAIYWVTSNLPGDLSRAVVDGILQSSGMLASGNNRRFLREMAGTRLRVISGNGRRLLAYSSGTWKPGNLWYRRHMAYGQRGLGKLKVSAMNLAIRGVGENIADGLKGLSGRAGAIGMVFAVSFDIAEYITSDGEKFRSDLLVSIGFTVANAVLSIIVGTMIAAAAVAAAIAAGVALAPAVIVGLGIAAVVGVGFAINRVVALTGLKTAVQEFVRDLDWYEEGWKSGMTDAEIYEGMMTAP